METRKVFDKSIHKEGIITGDFGECHTQSFHSSLQEATPTSTLQKGLSALILCSLVLSSTSLNWRRKWQSTLILA